MYKLYLKRILFVILIVSLSSCGSMIMNRAASLTTIENNAIPPEFGKQTTTLICVLIGRNSRDNYLKKYVEAEYHGPYVYVLREDLEDPKYSDTNTYRYVFDYNERQSSIMRQNPRTGTMRFSNASSSIYFIKDRKTDSTYTNKLASGYFAKLIEGYMIALEKARVSDN